MFYHNKKNSRKSSAYTRNQERMSSADQKCKEFLHDRRVDSTLKWKNWTLKNLSPIADILLWKYRSLEKKQMWLLNVHNKEDICTKNVIQILTEKEYNMPGHD